MPVKEEEEGREERRGGEKRGSLLPQAKHKTGRRGVQGAFTRTRVCVAAAERGNAALGGHSSVRCSAAAYADWTGLRTAYWAVSWNSRAFPTSCWDGIWFVALLSAFTSVKRERRAFCASAARKFMALSRVPSLLLFCVLHRSRAGSSNTTTLKRFAETHLFIAGIYSCSPSADILAAVLPDAVTKITGLPCHCLLRAPDVVCAVRCGGGGGNWGGRNAGGRGGQRRARQRWRARLRLLLQRTPPVLQADA